MEITIRIGLLVFFLLIGLFYFSPLAEIAYWKKCRKEGHILRVNSSGYKVPRHILTHCVRCGRYLGTESDFPNEKIKGYEEYPHQYKS